MKKPPAIQADWPPILPGAAFLSFALCIRIAIPLAPELRPWFLELTALGGMAVILLTRRSTKNSILKSLFGNTKSIWSLLPGLILGGVVVGIPLLADVFIGWTALSQDPLFAGAEGRVLDAAPIGSQTILHVFLIEPFLGQMIVLGICMAPWAHKVRSGLFLGISAGLFVLVLWDFSAAGLLTGAVSGLLLQRTGAISCGIVFQALSGLSGLLMVYVYPRSITLLGFLL